jgi:hypothetical protein
MFCSNCGKEIEGDVRLCASCGNPVGSAALPPVPAGRRPAIFGASFIDAQASVAPGEKKRHGCLTAYLILMIVANSALALVYLLASDTIRGNLRRSSEWVLPVLVVLALFNLVCAIALFRWKEWGFWGCCVSTIVGFLVNLAAGLGVFQSILGLAGMSILYGVLHIGTENEGWIQLE